jgi:hypothetical protein
MEDGVEENNTISYNIASDIKVIGMPLTPLLAQLTTIQGGRQLVQFRTGKLSLKVLHSNSQLIPELPVFTSPTLTTRSLVLIIVGC